MTLNQTRRSFRKTHLKLSNPQQNLVNDFRKLKQNEKRSNNILGFVFKSVGYKHKV